MADTIRIKRRTSGAVGAPSGLANAELAYNEVDHTLYYGEGTGGAGGTATAVVPVGGTGAFAPVNNPTFTGTVRGPIFQADTGVTVVAGNVSAPSGNVTGVNINASTGMTVGGVNVATTAQLPIASSTTPAMDGTAAIGTGVTYARNDHVHPSDTSRLAVSAASSTYAPIASPIFTGTVKGPIFQADTSVTVVAGNVSAPAGNVTGVNINASTGMTVGGVNVATVTQLPAASSTTPVMDGTAAIGAGTTYARNDHVHPSDTSRLAVSVASSTYAPLASPTFTGTVSAPVFSANTGITVLAGNISAPSGNVSGVNITATTTMTLNGVSVATTTDVANAIQGIDAKASCIVASTANVATLSGAQTVDGFSVQTNDRVLLKDQTTASQNGIYVGNTVGAWSRATDADTWNELRSAFTFIEQGTVNADTGWLCTVDSTGTLGTTAVPWTQFSGAGSVIGGAGLLKTGNQLDVGGTAGRINVTADNVDIDAAYAGQTSITTLGTVGTGTWNASTITVAKGGSGATTLTGYLVGNGTSAFTAVASIPSTAITGLGTMAGQNANAVAITGGTIDGVTFDGGTF